MKNIYIIPIFILLCYNLSWSQCPASVTISGVYATLYTGSNSWIASSGLTTIPTGADVTLDANPATNGYVLLDTGFETQPNATFLAIVVTPCSLLANETFNESKSFLVYPNPVTSILYIESSTIIKSISIMDVNGRIIFENKNDSEIMTINTENLTSGIYFLKVINVNGTSIQKIIKN
jgi:Secretion system C-terminal sorting domain